MQAGHGAISLATAFHRQPHHAMPVQDTYRLLLLLALSLAGVTAQNATVAKGNATNPTMSILDGHLHFQVPKNMDVT